jgi:hypothetical protein
MLLLEGAWSSRMIVYLYWPLDMIYFLLFLLDFIPFFMLWFIQSKWEFQTRVIDIFWLIMLMTILLPTGVGPGLFVVFCIQFVLLIWPKPYVSDYTEQAEEEIDNDDNFVRLKCSSCGATYTYSSEVIENKEVICQNCGKSVET